MAWVRIDDHIDEHPKLAAAGPLGLALFVAGLAYSNRNLTDGFIPQAVAHRLLLWEDPNGRISVTNGVQVNDVDSELVAETLVDVGLWKRVKGGYRVHDYHEFQPTKERVMAEREAAKQRMRKARESRGSPEHREKLPRSSEEFAGSSPNPDPVPNPFRSNTATAAAERATPAAADDQLLNRLHELGWGHPEIKLARLEPGRAEAWLTKAERHATSNTGGYAWAGFRDGGWPGDEPQQEKPKRPLLDVAQDLIRQLATEYPDDALLDELGILERKRDEQLTDTQRAELLELAHERRQETAAA